MSIGKTRSYSSDMIMARSPPLILASMVYFFFLPRANAGSACTSGSLDPSHVLLAIGLPHEVAHGSLRLTLCEENTPEQIEYIIKEVPEIVSYLRNISPVWEELEKGEKKHVI